MGDPAASTSSHVGRQGTRQEVFESKGKRGSSSASNTSGAPTKASVYSNPLPLYISNTNSSLSLLWSITWSLSLSCQILAAQLKPKSKSRNKVPKSAYIDEKIQGYWDERTKSVWVLPNRKKTKAARRRAGQNSTEQQQRGESIASTSSGSASSTLVSDDNYEKEEITPWMDQLWKKGFFGKGSLSRSEPTWWQREKNRVTGEHGEKLICLATSFLRISVTNQRY